MKNDKYSKIQSFFRRGNQGQQIHRRGGRNYPSVGCGRKALHYMPLCQCCHRSTVAKIGDQVAMAEPKQT